MQGSAFATACPMQMGDASLEAIITLSGLAALQEEVELTPD